MKKKKKSPKTEWFGYADEVVVFFLFFLEYKVTQGVSEAPSRCRDPGPHSQREGTRSR